jgi:large subunit ribosomal protein L30e
MKDIRSDLGSVIKTGKIEVGSKNVLSGLLMENPKLVIISGNCPNDVKERVVYYSRLSKTPYHITEENSVELGSICGKPFPVCALSVKDAGESDIVSKYKTVDKN